MSDDLVKLLRRPYGNLTGDERKAVASRIEELEAQLEDKRGGEMTDEELVKHCMCGCMYLEAECPNCNKVTDADRIEALEAQLAKATEVVEQSGRMRGELEARLEAMTLQHAAALEAVATAREAALREAADVCDGSSWLSRGTRDEILALISKGASRE
jgi:hypothetical protein